MSIYVFMIRTKNSVYRFTTDQTMVGTLETIYSGSTMPFVEHDVEITRMVEGVPMIGQNDDGGFIRTSNVVSVIARRIPVKVTA